MEPDIQKWITHINIQNTRKRKAKFDEDNLIKELNYQSIDNLSTTIKKEKIKNNKLELFLESLKFVYIQSKKIYNKDKKTNL